MHKIVISDTSSLILFHKINELELLKKVYETIITTPQVADEFIEKLPDWIRVQDVKDKKYIDFLITQVDLGEASAIALAKELDNPLLLIDDLKARNLAKQLHLRFTGSLGVIHKAKQIGVIPKIKPYVDKILSTDFRISKRIISELLLINNEK